MFCNNRLILAFVLSLLFVEKCVCLRNDCTDVTGCACGEQCVDVDDLKLCHSSHCVCRAGCAVGDIWIPAGVSRPRTYCNLCACPSPPGQGLPMCTRAVWCNLPANRPLYQTNPACN